MKTLPSLLRFSDGTPVASPADWPRRRAELAAAILPLEYGGMPPAPANTRWQQVSRSHGPRIAPPGCQYVAGRVIACGDDPSGDGSKSRVPSPKSEVVFPLRLFLPPGDGPHPVILSGDECWWWLTTAMVNEALTRGFAVAVFNRCELAPDEPGPYADAKDPNWRTRGIYPIYPGPYGALSAWAWGYHRAIDALLQTGFIDPARIAITGHSRGGKTVLLAAATDERVALVGDNCSGCCGSGSHLLRGDGAESIASITRDLGKWFGPDFAAYASREDELPFDQHFLCALVAPRALQVNVALDDRWANPRGTWAIHLATREAYRFLGVPDAIAINFREGPHRYGADDWSRFLDFCSWRLCDGLRPVALDRRPDWATPV